MRIKKLSFGLPSGDAVADADYDSDDMTIMMLWLNILIDFDAGFGVVLVPYGEDMA